MAKRKKKTGLPYRHLVSMPKCSPVVLVDVIGSSCTWGAHELDEFKVIYMILPVQGVTLFDESNKWFDFTNLDYYQRRISSLIIPNEVKEQLLSIKTVQEAASRTALLDKAPWLDTVFKFFANLYVTKTITQDENLAAKRRDRSKRRKAEQQSPSIRLRKRTFAMPAMPAMSKNQDENIIPGQ